MNQEIWIFFSLSLFVLLFLILSIFIYFFLLKNKKIKNLDHTIRDLDEKLIDLKKKLDEKDVLLEKERKDKNLSIQKDLENIQKLKDKQDGDYFLTSLLIEPFVKNNGSDEVVQIEYILRQYKKFTFRKFNREIGGDIFLSRKIVLLGRTYTVLFNADAMGKSIQGAGGAIVTGAAMQSILDRNRSRRNQKLTPERWLFETYRDMNYIFKSFQGHMIISIYLALVDDSTGLLYYINCDHPPTAIYRDKVATFIDNPMDFPKLGMSFGPRFFRVRLFRLEEGDILIGGSDGRSDLLIEEEKIKTVYSMDEEHFLKLVEKENAQLNNILETLKKDGEIADDITLFSLQYFPNKKGKKKLSEKEKEKIRIYFQKSENREKIKSKIKQMYKVLKIDPGNIDSLYNLSELFYIKKLYKRSQYYAYRVLQVAPWSLKALLLYIKTSVKRHDYSNATAAYEMLTFRYPDKISYHVKFAELKMEVRGYAHALKIVNEILEVKPEEKRAIVLKKQIQLKIDQK